jgi:hypothetical protein
MPSALAYTRFRSGHAGNVLAIVGCVPLAVSDRTQRLAWTPVLQHDQRQVVALAARPGLYALDDRVADAFRWR